MVSECGFRSASGDSECFRSCHSLWEGCVSNVSSRLARALRSGHQVAFFVGASPALVGYYLLGKSPVLMGLLAAAGAVRAAHLGAKAETGM